MRGKEPKGLVVRLNRAATSPEIQDRSDIESLPGRLTLIRSIRSLQQLCVEKRTTPAMVVGTVLRIWIKNAYPMLPTSGVPWSDTLAVQSQVATFESLLRRLPLQESTYWLSTAYAALSAPEYRKRLAMYFTPPLIANRLLDDLVDAGARFDQHCFMDPACGGAAFLALVADRMRTDLLIRGATSAAALSHAEAHIAGIEIDQTLCSMASHFLRMVFYREICVCNRIPRFKVRNGDSITAFDRLHNSYDVVVCNPPYRKLSRQEADGHRPNYGESMQGQPNLYAIFVQLSTRFAKSNGIVGLVTPTSFLSGQSFSSLRSFLLTQAVVKHIGIIRDRQRVYFDVEQDTALTVVRTGNQAQHEKIVAGVSVIDRTGQYKKIGHCPLPNSGSSWPLARDVDDVSLLRRVAKSKARIMDYGYTATIGGFVWNRDTRTTYSCYDRIPAQRRANTYPLLWASDLHATGNLIFDGQRESPAQHRYVYLGSSGRALVKTKPAVLLQRVTASDQERRLVGATVSKRFVMEHGGYVGENHVVILEQTADDPALSPKQMLELLNSSVVNRYFNCISGCANVSIFELQQVPIPDPLALISLIASGLSVRRAVEELLLGHSIPNS